MRHTNGNFLITHHRNKSWNVTTWVQAGQPQFQTFSAVQSVFGHVLFQHQDWAIYNLQWFTCDPVAQGQNAFSQGARVPAASPPQISDCCRQHLLPLCPTDPHIQDLCQCIVIRLVHRRSPQRLWNGAPVHFSRRKHFSGLQLESLLQTMR